MLTSFYLCWHVYFYVCSHWKALKKSERLEFYFLKFVILSVLHYYKLMVSMSSQNSQVYTGTNQGLREKNISYNTIMIRFIFWHVFFLNSTYQLNTKIYLNNWRVSKLSYNVLKKKTHLINIWITKTQGWMLKQVN